ncbi:transcriptional regulator [Rhizobium sp. Root1220]|nr:transcriptional regulator [Rhizobium sp. Root1220]
MESARTALSRPPSSIGIRMLGPLTVVRDNDKVDLPTSRKARALFAYLALAPRAVARSRLCEMFWDVPSDPRGELRWCLSKLRGVIDDADRKRVDASDDTIALHIDDCMVDVVELATATSQGLESLPVERLKSLFGLFAGEFLDGMAVDRSPVFTNWLIAQRRRFNACHIAVLEQLFSRFPAGSDEAYYYVEKWVELAPFDGRSHLALLDSLAQRGQVGACEQHLAAASELFASDGLDFTPVRDAWQGGQKQKATVQRSVQTLSASRVLPLITDPADRRIAKSDHASLAVMPFYLEGPTNGQRGGLTDALTHDIITRLARLRNLFVIARGSVFALAEKNIGPEEAGRALNVDYVASGSVLQRERSVTVTVELVDVRTARIVWTEVLDHSIDDTFVLLNEIGDQIVSSICNEIEMVERNRAILKAPTSLNAWEAYHRGLWHMYRFTRLENEQARQFFEMSVRLDPTFARAHAGLSFTHWQSAFQRWGDHTEQSRRAMEAASQSLLADDNNPASHWAMGRALWLRGQQDESVLELQHAVDLSPNFALGHYALSFVQSQSGDPLAAIGSSDHSRHLSPVDPLLFGMLGARAMAHVRLGQFEEAADWALRAAKRPNAHVIILAIAAHCLALAGRIDEGRNFCALIRKTLPRYRADDFLATFRFDPDATALFRLAARRIGLD